MIHFGHKTLVLLPLLKPVNGKQIIDDETPDIAKTFNQFLNENLIEEWVCYLFDVVLKKVLSLQKFYSKRREESK